MPAHLPSLACLALAYAAGCFNAGYYLVRWLRGEDIRRRFSGSTGARNAGRLLGRPAFFAVFLLDAGKGALAVALARLLDADPRVVPWMIPLAVAGHVWPAQLGFAGGKGIAAAFGAVAAYDVRLGAAAFLLPFLLYKLGGRLGPAGAAGLGLLPFLPFPAWSWNQVAALSAASLAVAAAHLGNLRKGGISWSEP
jgi:glycerol-3-phosphate acyltransferase PlsY